MYEIYKTHVRIKNAEISREKKIYIFTNVYYENLDHIFFSKLFRCILNSSLCANTVCSTLAALVQNNTNCKDLTSHCHFEQP